MVAKGSQNTSENNQVEGNKTRQPMLLTEEKLYASDIFRMFCYKVLPCTKVYNHNWKTCPFLHEGEKAGRRDPQKHRYVGIECHEVKQGAECPRGIECPYAHNLFEFWLHPTRYRTQLCNKPATCRRKVCFFAHNVEELRQPSSNFSTLEGGLPSSPSDSNSSSLSETEISSTQSTLIIDCDKNTFGQQGQNVCPTESEQKLSCLNSASYSERNLPSPLLGSFSADCSVSNKASSICGAVLGNVPSLKFCRASSGNISAGDSAPHSRASPQIPAYRCESSESVPESDNSVPLDFPLEALFPPLGGTFEEAASEAEMALYNKQHHHLLSLSNETSHSSIS